MTPLVGQTRIITEGRGTATWTIPREANAAQLLTSVEQRARSAGVRTSRREHELSLSGGTWEGMNRFATLDSGKVIVDESSDGPRVRFDYTVSPTPLQIAGVMAGLALVVAVVSGATWLAAFVATSVASCLGIVAGLFACWRVEAEVQTAIAEAQPTPR
jgi:hypothetical protein